MTNYLVPANWFHQGNQSQGITEAKGEQLIASFQVGWDKQLRKNSLSCISKKKKYING